MKDFDSYDVALKLLMKNSITKDNKNNKIKIDQFNRILLFILLHMII